MNPCLESRDVFSLSFTTHLKPFQLRFIMRLMFKKALTKSSPKLSNVLRFLVWFVPLLVAVFSVIDFLFRWKIIATILFWAGRVCKWAIEQATATPLLSGLFLAVTVFTWVFMWRLRKRLQIVAGEFRDDFTGGLYKWEYGGEGWKVEHADGEPILSVSESPDGGITKKGFSWSDYEFSFETKVIKNASGWLIRATNRNNYVMIQLSLQDRNKPMLRPHYRYSDPETPWVLFDEVDLEVEVKRLEWIRVKIVVRGSTVDVFLNDEHALHFFLPDPIRFEKVRKVLNETGKEVKEVKGLIALSYPTGRVGFRCSSSTQEHAHFRNVRVKPL